MIDQFKALMGHGLGNAPIKLLYEGHTGGKHRSRSLRLAWVETVWYQYVV